MEDITTHLKLFDKANAERAANNHDILMSEIDFVYGALDDHSIFSRSTGQEIFIVFFLANGNIVTTDADWPTDDGKEHFGARGDFEDGVTIVHHKEVW